MLGSALYPLVFPCGSLPRVCLCLPDCITQSVAPVGIPLPYPLPVEWVTLLRGLWSEEDQFEDFYFFAFPYGGVTMGLGLRVLSGDSAVYHS